MTPAMNTLVRKRLERICWWLKAENLGHCDLLSAAWETLRRTSAFKQYGKQAMAIAHQVRDTHIFGKVAGIGALRAIPFAKQPANVSCDAWLPLGPHDPILNWEGLFVFGCTPDLHWMELGDEGRHVVRTRSPILPRQDRAESSSAMHIFVCRLERDTLDPNEERITGMEWTDSVDEKPLPKSGFRVLPADAERETYVVVSLELGQPAEALERKFLSELEFRLYPGRKNGQPCNLITAAAGVAKWHSDVPPNELVYPRLWEAALDPNARPRTQDNVVIIPNRQSPFVLCWIPARNNWEQVRSRFHNAVRDEKRDDLEKMCSAYWAKPEVVPGVMGGREEVLPPWPAYHGIDPTLKRKPAHFREFWLGLTAFEFRQAGIIAFDKSPDGQAALAFFKANGLPDDPDLIRPALASVNERLREIDELYANLF